MRCSLPWSGNLTNTPQVGRFSSQIGASGPCPELKSQCAAVESLQRIVATFFKVDLKPVVQDAPMPVAVLIVEGLAAHFL